MIVSNIEEPCSSYRRHHILQPSNLFLKFWWVLLYQPFCNIFSNMVLSTRLLTGSSISQVSLARIYQTWSNSPKAWANMVSSSLKTLILTFRYFLTFVCNTSSWVIRTFLDLDGPLEQGNPGQVLLYLQSWDSSFCSATDRRRDTFVWQNQKQKASNYCVNREKVMTALL